MEQLCLNIFGGACLSWAVLLTIGIIVEKGKLFVKGKERLGYGITIGLYILGALLLFL